jgi:hypothetical protein
MTASTSWQMGQWAWMRLSFCYSTSANRQFASTKPAELGRLLDGLGAERARLGGAVVPMLRQMLGLRCLDEVLDALRVGLPVGRGW